MKKNDIWEGARHFLFLLGAIAVTLFQYLLAEIYHNDTYEEGGIIENLQIAFLFASIVLLFFIGKKYVHYHYLSYLASSACALAVCRELDAFLDAALPVVSWRIGFLFLLAAICIACKHKKEFFKEIASFVYTKTFSIMSSSIIIIIPIAQMIGHNNFLKKVLPAGTDNISLIKEIIEESIETFGYYLILCSAIELFYFCKSMRSKQITQNGN